MAKKRVRRNGTDAVAMLRADHEKVAKLFKKFEGLHKDEANDEAEQVATQICNELTVHTKIEEEIFYPALREAIDEGDLLNEAEVEHATCKDLIAQIGKMSPDDEMYAAKVIYSVNTSITTSKRNTARCFQKPRRQRSWT